MQNILLNSNARFYYSKEKNDWNRDWVFPVGVDDTTVCFAVVCTLGPVFRPILIGQVRIGQKWVGPKWIGWKVGLPVRGIPSPPCWIFLFLNHGWKNYDLDTLKTHLRIEALTLWSQSFGSPFKQKKRLAFFFQW